MPILKVEKLCKKYERFYLDNVSFSLDEGYIMGFIGSNGAGKTTTLKGISSVIVIVYIFSIEILALINDTFRYYLEGNNTECLLTQYSILGAGILIFIFLSYISVRISCGRFEKINL